MSLTVSEPGSTEEHTLDVEDPGLKPDEVTSHADEFLSNVAQGSRKDLRDAVLAARGVISVTDRTAHIARVRDLARKVAKLRGAGNDKAYEKARDDYLQRYGKHGGDEALRKALKDGAATAGPQPLPEDRSKLEEGVPYTINNQTWYWNGKEFTDQKPD